MKDLETKNVQLLLVEDNPRYRQLLEEDWLKKRFGYQNVDTARNAKQAEENLNQRSYDVIIADMRLDSDDAGGFAVLNEVKKRNITSVVIILTANDTVEDCRQAFREGAWDYISKSMKDTDSFDELHKSIQDAISYFNRWGKREDELWLEEHLDELVYQYNGQYVAILNNSVLATAATEEKLKQELAERKLPLFLPMIRKVGDVRPIIELIALGESAALEFKSTLRWAVKQNRQIDDLQYQVLKTIVAFLNSEGGTLLIGIEDDGTIFGLEHDIACVKNKNLDGFEQTLMNLIHAHIGSKFARLIRVRFEDIENKQVCAIETSKSNQPAYLLKKGGVKEFYIREGNGSRSLDIEEAINYIQMHFNLR